MIELIILICIITTGFFLSFRNNWVYKVRRKLIDEDMVKYDTLQSYNYMFYHFWVWDIEKFIKEKEDATV